MTLRGGYAEQSISAITFHSTYADSDPQGPPGFYTLDYNCQFVIQPYQIMNPLGWTSQV